MICKSHFEIKTNRDMLSFYKRIPLGAGTDVFMNGFEIFNFKIFFRQDGDLPRIIPNQELALLQRKRVDFVWKRLL